MASGDYRSCDSCGCKAFYDANLNYDGHTEFANSGGVLFNNDRSYIELDSLGSWIVLCKDCSLKHKIGFIDELTRLKAENERLKKQNNLKTSTFGLVKKSAMKYANSKRPKEIDSNTWSKSKERRIAYEAFIVGAKCEHQWMKIENEKLKEAARVLVGALENAKMDLDDLDVTLMADYKIVMSGFSRARLSIQTELAKYKEMME